MFHLQEFCAGRDDCGGHFECNETTGAQACLSGWKGADCKVRDFSGPGVDPECPPNSDCGGPAGVCFNSTCCCNSGYIGEFCLVEINECDSNPCQNGGTCKDEINGYLCQCAPGMFSFTMFYYIYFFVHYVKTYMI